MIYKIKLNQTKVSPEDVLTVDTDELVLVPKASVLASIRKKHIILEQFPHEDEEIDYWDPKCRHVCQITNIERNIITFSCNTLDQLMKCLLQASTTLRSYLFPLHDIRNINIQTSGSDLSTPLTLINASIATNVDQLQAVNQIVAGPSPLAPYIVFGPPGTGKTTTIVEAILQLYLKSPDNRIVVTAGSNSACDTIALRIFACMARAKTEVKHATHVFIDEAAASSEPELLLGIVHLKATSWHVILSGDHKQLGPVIKSKRASSLGLGQSLMGRLMDSELYQVDDNGSYDCRLQTRLRRNYRSHPEIVGLFNKLFYNNELIPVAPLERINQAAHWDMLSNGQFPILFQATFGKTQRPPLSHSSYNELEAEVLCWFVWNLLKRGLGNGSKVRQEDIGVITPYLAQCALLTKYLRQRGKFHVKVGSVESFQGREKPIIIASLVCSFTSAAFLSDPRRLNVLLSRPMSLLILIGNPISLSQSADLKFIIDQCKLHGHLLTKKNDKKNKKIERTHKAGADTHSTDMSKQDTKKLNSKENSETTSTKAKNKKFKNNKKKMQKNDNTKTLFPEMSNLTLNSSTTSDQSKEILT
ncbi:hypothetical protein ACLKA7_013891 [Drosophila subpalustris]